MSAALSINGKNLVPIKEAVGSTAYTRDYIAKLAREGQIVAAQVGRQWYVDLVSLENFRNASELEAQVRRRHLSQVRRKERDLQQAVTKHFDIVAVKGRRAVARAVVQSVLIVVVGLSTGYFMNALAHLNAGLFLVQKAQTYFLAGGMGADLGTESKVENLFDDSRVTTTVLEQVSFSAVDEVVTLAAGEGVLILPNTATASSVAEVEQLFSDPVKVFSTSPTGGEVILGTSTATRTVPFVIVPVDAQGSEVAVVRPEDKRSAP